MTTSLTADAMKKLQGKCLGCFHVAVSSGNQPGPSSICKLCVRNKNASPDTAVPADDGRLTYGLRDCYVAKDRFNMDIKGETFLKGVELGG